MSLSAHGPRRRRLVEVLDGMTIESDGELTPYGQDLAEELHHRTWPDDDDRQRMEPEPYPDSAVY